MTLSTYAANAFNDWISGKTAMPSLPTPYCALMTVAVSAGNTGGTETAYTGYARVAVASSFGTSSGGTKSNTALIAFPNCTASAGAAIVQFALFDAITGGNLLATGPCSYQPAVGNAPQFPIGSLTLTET